MTTARRAALTWLAVGLLLGGCASHTPLQKTDKTGFWSGRLSLRVEDQPSQSFSAAFELSGSPQAGDFQLLNPLGGTLALLQWSAARARLQASGKSYEYESLQAMIDNAAGTSLPVTTLFDWLDGREGRPGATRSADWLVDLGQYAQGRITATRAQPAAELRIVLDRP